MMRKFAHVTATLALFALAAGCASTKTASRYQGITADYTAVGVRFVVPPMPKSTDPSLAATGSSFVSDSNYGGLVPVAHLAGESISHVALWGGGFNGHDVTYASTALQPGMYTFAYMTPDKDDAVQGWMDVNPGGTEILDFLMRWYNNIPQMREALAFELELAGGTKVRDTAIFEGFMTQLRAFDRLESQLAQAIANERQAQAEAAWQYNQFLRNAEILLLPSEMGFFHPTTQPAITKAELASVESGKTVSKVVLLADADNALWKLKRVNQVYNELNRCKTVLMEEADRLQRRKRFYTLTDHIYNHDKLFVHNELRLQQTFAAIDQLNEQVSELRDRRMALAFVSELTAPDGTFRTLDGEESDLNREKTVLQAKLNQINHLFNEAEDNSAKRVILERNRQEVVRAIEGVDTQLTQVDQARVALTAMNQDTEIIHRQGNWRLMTASLTGQDIPFTVRRAIEQEALMTVRLEPTKTMYIPSSTHMTAMPPMMTPNYTKFTYHNMNGVVQLVVETSNGSVTTVSNDDVFTYATAPKTTTTVTTYSSSPPHATTVSAKPSARPTTVYSTTSNQANQANQSTWSNRSAPPTSATQPTQPTHGGQPDQAKHPSRPNQPSRSNQSSQANEPSQSDRFSQADQPSQSDRYSQTNQPSQPDRYSQANQPPSQSDRYSQANQPPSQSDRHSQANEPSRSDRYSQADQPSQSDRYSQADQPSQRDRYSQADGSSQSKQSTRSSRQSGLNQPSRSQQAQGSSSSTYSDQPSRSHDSTVKKTSHTPSQTQPQAQKNEQKKDGCKIGCPFFRLLAPPCWFAKD